MRKSCRVMVTGAGSGVGQGIIKALKISNLPVTIVVADISTMNVALYRNKDAILIPPVEQENALEIVISILKRSRIDVVMIGSEYELNFFSSNREEIELRSGALIVVAPIETVTIANDKWLTAEFLKVHNLPYAESYLPIDVEDALQKASEWGCPIVLKTRCGTSSRHVYIINNEDELRRFYPDTPLPMLQQVIDIPSSQLGSEYTCSVFKGSCGKLIGPFTARRTVRGGTSWHIEVSEFKNLYETLLAIASSIDYIGSLNVQLMLTKQGAVPFELNARFSGTTAVRAHFGFNEPEMSLLSLFYKEDVPEPVLSSGIAMRYHEEVFIPVAGKDNLLLGLNNGVINQWF